jgi:hypothetical protein
VLVYNPGSLEKAIQTNFPSAMNLGRIIIHSKERGSAGRDMQALASARRLLLLDMLASVPADQTYNLCLRECRKSDSVTDSIDLEALPGIPGKFSRVICQTGGCICVLKRCRPIIGLFLFFS